MQVIPRPAQWQAIRLQLIHSDQTLGLVPTMGALHQGHLDLVSRSLEKCDYTLVSIFVNPTQFNNPEDFAKYPQSLEQDLKLLEKAGVDAVFLPTVETMYPSKPRIKLDFGSLEQILEGASRPGHFNGVGIIVSKLFHMIQPDIAFFGQKDLQQVAIIQSLVRELSFPVQLEIVPTRRELDGLAMSSRNRRLSESERKQALLLYESLSDAKDLLIKGHAWEKVKKSAETLFEKEEGVTLDYFALVDQEKFELLDAYDPAKKSSLCIAAFVGEIRLIDNLPINA
ncbi:pantoate--beta-alanine ligase [Algoriphagus sp.]|uniref:pantoate--beta-alanine ligase n=1 Tax=Algoriphagus sp. TaxID=1872435 RepID=UPI0026092D76|nr:pantoate--beta-alanine ligase [Algoriphagus sp.]